MSQINETAIRTPGVYTTEIPTLPPSVAQVSTAIPAFIGYTQKRIDEDGVVIPSGTIKPIKIFSHSGEMPIRTSPFCKSPGVSMRS